eukprot:TRINITY_DN61959_c0_g1_i1.p1 TRINITY_DN61959_c0_g1~~TRINITY_DN61959_c0_g1_i1.p1  ORF type:complete len:1392 (-),score=331.78 TRINITY_DN61959_c0_g1_i1:32-4207(-)
MARKSAKEQKDASSEEDAGSEWVCAVAVVIFVAAFSLSGQIFPRLVTSQCTAEQGMCTPGECTCPFPLMKRDLVTQDALPCSQCIEEFCPAVIQGDPSCSEAACECEDSSWPRTNLGTEEKPCWQCAHPSVDSTLRPRPSAEGGGCFMLPAKESYTGRLETADAWNESSCTVFRFNGANILVKSHNRSCLVWSDGSWQLADCEGATSSVKFKQYTSEASSDTFCTGRASEFCLEPAEYMCTTDPTQCSTGHCRCEDPSHVRKELQTLSRSPCFLCAPPLPSCPLSPEPCAAGPCECRGPGLVKVRHSSASEEASSCYSCRPAGYASQGFGWLADWASALAMFAACVFFGLAVGCGIRRLWGGDALVTPPQRRRRRGHVADSSRSWSERWAIHLEDALEAGTELARTWKPFRRVSSAVCSVIDVADNALEPAYQVLDLAFDKAQAAFEKLQSHAQKAFQSQKAEVAPRGKRNVAQQGSAKKGAAAGSGKHTSTGDAGTAKSSLFMRAASQAMKESSVGFPADLAWDPLNSDNCHEEGEEVLKIPKEWMKLVTPSAAASQASAASNSGSTSRTQKSVLQRLRQRREAKQVAAAKAEVPMEKAVEAAPVDESWIDDLEREAKEKEAKERAAAQRREKKNAMRSARRAKQSASQPHAESDVAGKAAADEEVSEAVEEQKNEAMSKVVEQDAPGLSSVEDLIKMVGAAGLDEDGAMQPELLLSEAMHGLFLLSSAKSEDADADATDELQFDGGRREGRRQGEKEPAEEPDPQPQPDPQPDPPSDPQPQELNADDVQEVTQLSRRQLQRQRQRAAAARAATSPQGVAATKPKQAETEKGEALPKPQAISQPQEAPQVRSQPKPVLRQTASPVPQPVQEGAAEAAPVGPPRAFADVVAGRPARPQRDAEEESNEAADAAMGSKSFDVDAQEFIPLSMLPEMPMQISSAAYAALMAQTAEPSSSSWSGRRSKKRKEATCDDSQALPVTTVVVEGVPENQDGESFRYLLDAWGLMGTYNFFYMPPKRKEDTGKRAIVNFVEPSFLSYCQCIFQQSEVEGTVAIADVQGLENNVAHWNERVRKEDLVNGPLVFPGAMNLQWADGMLGHRFSPQIRGQFHKTKMCAFNKSNKCTMGASCPFAHSKEELQQMPDLKKTKLCYNFYRKKCNDAKCKFAHGYSELRATQTVYRTELCRWWAAGSCKAGDSCRYAHGLEELRTLVPQVSSPHQLPEELQDAMAGEVQAFNAGYDLLGQLDYTWEDQAALMQQCALSATGPLYPAVEETGSGDPQGESPFDAVMMQDRTVTINSDMGLSDASTFFGQGDAVRIPRQQTAPPASYAVSQDDGNIMLRVKSTFMEAVCVDDDFPQVSMRRSWSDGDLLQLSQAMEVNDSDTEECNPNDL